jgi:Bifunctional DNA primase/polymerase, N-terminal/Primase C terminal 2 (PriCT-2)
VQNVWFPSFPLVGVPTGKRNGFDVLDIDGKAGRSWYFRNCEALPPTRVHYTRRGVHIFFIHSPGLRCSASKIAPGIDVRADLGYCIWWPREGYEVADHPLAEWPEWLLAEAMGPGRGKRTLSRSLSYQHQHDVVVADRTEALRKLDPCMWNGKHDEWFELLMGCKAAGIDREDFVEWSTGDPDYADDADIIRVKWDSVEPKHAGAFFAALKAQGIKLQHRASNRYSFAEGPSRSQPTRDLRLRTNGLFNWLAKAPREDRLFVVAATFAEIIHEKRIKLSVANHLLEQACKANGLWHDLGSDGCRQTIANAFRHVEEKLLETMQ